MAGAAESGGVTTIKFKHEHGTVIHKEPCGAGQGIPYERVMQIVEGRFGSVRVGYMDTFMGKPMLASVGSKAEWETYVRHTQRPYGATGQGAGGSGQGSGRMVLYIVGEDELFHLVRRLAVDLFNAANKAEPAITGVLQAMADECNGRLVGLEYRFKTRTSMERKLYKKLKDSGLSAEAVNDGDFAVKAIKDALRYTVVLDTDRYTGGVIKVLAALRALGMEEFKIKNYWNTHEVVSESGAGVGGEGSGSGGSGGPSAGGEFAPEILQSFLDGGVMSVVATREGYKQRMPTPTVYGSPDTVRNGDEYQGINAVFRKPDTGMLWEVQFHTPQSLDVKHASHRVYSQFRVASDEVDAVAMHEMRWEMAELWGSVPPPDAVESLGDPVGLKKADPLPAIPPEQAAEFEARKAAKTAALQQARNLRHAWALSGLVEEEGAVTRVIMDLAAHFDEAVELMDLDDRLRNKYQLRASITELAESHGIPLEQAASRVTDSLCFYVVITPAEYARVLGDWVHTMTDTPAVNLSLVRVDDTWDAGTGVNTVWRVDPDGPASPSLIFTVGFHTVESHRLAKTIALHGDASHAHDLVTPWTPVGTVETLAAVAQFVVPDPMFESSGSG